MGGGSEARGCEMREATEGGGSDEWMEGAKRRVDGRSEANQNSIAGGLVVWTA